MLYVKKQQIDAIRDGDRVEDVFAVKMKKGFSQYAKGWFFHILLTDSSGKSIDYKYWGGSDEARVRRIYESIPSDGVVYLQGKAAIYADKIQISTNEPDTINPLASGEYNPADFIQPARADVGKSWLEIQGHISSVKNQQLKTVLEHVFNDPTVAEKFRTHPGAIEIHHNWTGGLMQHTLEVVEYAKLSCNMHHELDRDLVVTGALLHDIGKLDELTVSTRIKGTRLGQLEGHLSLGYARVSKALDELRIEGAVGEKLLHIILSHHGKLEYGSPKEPMFPEAYAVYYADEASAQLTEMLEYVKWARESTEDDFMYHKRRGRNILLR